MNGQVQVGMNNDEIQGYTVINGLSYFLTLFFVVYLQNRVF